MRRRCFVLNRRRVLLESVLPSAVRVSGSSGFESDFSQQVFKFPAFCSTAFLFIGKVSGWLHRAAEIGIKVFGFGSGQRAGCLTKRAADVWESARFTSIFLALSFFCFDGLVYTRPHVANANRWAASLQKYS